MDLGACVCYDMKNAAVEFLPRQELGLEVRNKGWMSCFGGKFGEIFGDAFRFTGVMSTEEAL